MIELECPECHGRFYIKIEVATLYEFFHCPYQEQFRCNSALIEVDWKKIPVDLSNAKGTIGES